jgi:D-beta-D-heptose 7-phosphate kinase/D-beta-D-heptose 1-phosphate adenosyltransferase
VRYLTTARQFGRLIVGVNSDGSTRRLKGPSRPIVAEGERAELLAALRCVDLVTVFDEPTAAELLRVLRPDIYIKGADYGPGGKELPEAELARAIGARVELVPLVPGRSTTAIVEAIRRCA